MVPSTQKEKMLRLCLAVKPHLWLGCGCSVPELETLIPNSPGIPTVEVRFGVAGPYKVTTKKTSLIPGSQAVFAFCWSFYTHMHFCSHEPCSLWFLSFCLAGDCVCYTVKYNLHNAFYSLFFLFFFTSVDLQLLTVAREIHPTKQWLLVLLSKPYWRKKSNTNYLGDIICCKSNVKYLKWLKAFSLNLLVPTKISTNIIICLEGSSC